MRHSYASVLTCFVCAFAIVIFIGHFPRKSPKISGSFAELTCKSMHRMGVCHPLGVETCIVYAFVIMRHWYACPIIFAAFIYWCILYMCYSFRGVLAVP